MNFERELREALRRPEPPAGFAERVMARVADEAPAAPRRREMSHAARAAAAAVLVIGITAAGWGGYRAEQRRRAEDAAEQAVTALRIVTEKINLAKETIDNHSAE